MPLQVISKGHCRPSCVTVLLQQKRSLGGESCSEPVSTPCLKDRNFSTLRTFHKFFYMWLIAKPLVFPGYIISCMNQHVDPRKATWSCNCTQNKYSRGSIGWHEFTASYLHYLMEDHLTSKQNREYFSLDIVFKTRLGISTEIRDREGILKGFLCLFPFVLYFYFVFSFQT